MLEQIFSSLPEITQNILSIAYVNNITVQLIPYVSVIHPPTKVDSRPLYLEFIYDHSIDQVVTNIDSFDPSDKINLHGFDQAITSKEYEAQFDINPWLTQSGELNNLEKEIFLLNFITEQFRASHYVYHYIDINGTRMIAKKHGLYWVELYPNEQLTNYLSVEDPNNLIVPKTQKDHTTMQTERIPFQDQRSFNKAMSLVLQGS